MKPNNKKSADGERMAQILSSGKVDFRGGQCIDTYNQQVWRDIFITVNTRVNSCCHYWVTQVVENE